MLSEELTNIKNFIDISMILVYFVLYCVLYVTLYKESKMTRIKILKSMVRGSKDFIWSMADKNNRNTLNYMPQTFLNYHWCEPKMKLWSTSYLRMS